MPLFHQVIASNANAYPSKPAIVLDGVGTSYQVLQQQTDDIASLLQTLGITPGSRVGLYSAISVELIAAYLGILKIGAVTAAIHRG